MEKLMLKNEFKELEVAESDLSGSDFKKCMLNNWQLNNVAMKSCKIIDADLSDLEIEAAQIGGAFIHNIGGPPEGHPAHDPNFKQRPVRFEDCNLQDSTITNCCLTGVEISDCNLKGMTIDGVLVEDLLAAYKKR